jgi:hypothetical protein
MSLDRTFLRSALNGKSRENSMHREGLVTYVAIAVVACSVDNAPLREKVFFQNALLAHALRVSDK